MDLLKIRAEALTMKSFASANVPHAAIFREPFVFFRLSSRSLIAHKV
jgi:hypothetical protein